MKERHCRKTATGNGQLKKKLWKKVITIQFDHFKVTHSQSAKSAMSLNSDTIETHLNNIYDGSKIEILKESINGIIYFLINLEVLVLKEKVEKEGKQTDKCFYFSSYF